MPTTAETIAALEAARNSGVLEVEVDGIRTKFRSLDEIERTLTTLRNGTLTTSPVRRIAFAIDSGIL